MVDIITHHNWFLMINLTIYLSTNQWSIWSKKKKRLWRYLSQRLRTSCFVHLTAMKLTNIHFNTRKRKYTRLRNWNNWFFCLFVYKGFLIISSNKNVCAQDVSILLEQTLHGIMLSLQYWRNWNIYIFIFIIIKDKVRIKIPSEEEPGRSQKKK